MSKSDPDLVALGTAAHNLLYNLKYYPSSVTSIYMSYPESEQEEALNRLREKWGKDIRQFLIDLKRAMEEI